MLAPGRLWRPRVVEELAAEVLPRLQGLKGPVQDHRHPLHREQPDVPSVLARPLGPPVVGSPGGTGRAQRGGARLVRANSAPPPTTSLLRVLIPKPLLRVPGGNGGPGLPDHTVVILHVEEVGEL